MAKKNFSEISTGNIYGQAAQAVSNKGKQAEPTEQEKHERREAMQTQGRKGCKSVRINMAFTDTNHEFLKVMARISGQSITQFCNYVIEQYRTEHPDIYDQAKAIIDKM